MDAHTVTTLARCVLPVTLSARNRDRWTLVQAHLLPGTSLARHISCQRTRKLFAPPSLNTHADRILATKGHDHENVITTKGHDHKNVITTKGHDHKNGNTRCIRGVFNPDSAWVESTTCISLSPSTHQTSRLTRTELCSQNRSHLQQRVFLMGRGAHQRRGAGASASHPSLPGKSALLWSSHAARSAWQWWNVQI